MMHMRCTRLRPDTGALLMRCMQEAEREVQLLLKGLGALDAHLQSRTYLAGHALSLADVILCCDLKPALEKVRAAWLLFAAQHARMCVADAVVSSRSHTHACMQS